MHILIQDFRTRESDRRVVRTGSDPEQTRVQRFLEVVGARGLDKNRLRHSMTDEQLRRRALDPLQDRKINRPA
jgi:hypothetical protein